MGPSLPSAHGMGYRVHGNPAYVGSLSYVSPPTCLSIGYVDVVRVASLTNRGAAILMNLADLSRGEHHLGIAAFPGKKTGHIPR